LVKLTGYGDPNRISKPEPIHEHQIQYYPEPEIPAEFNEDALGIKNTISWQYTFVAVDTGKIAIRLPFYFFNSTIDNIDSIIITDTIHAITSATSLANEISSSPEDTDKTYSNSRNIWIYVGISLLGFLILSAGIYIIWFIVNQRKNNIRHRNKGNSSSGLQINRIHTQLLEKYIFENNPDQFYKLLRDDMQGILESLKLENKDNTVEINLEQILSRLNFQEDEIHDWMQINQLASQYLYGVINHAYTDNSQLNEILTRYLVLRHKLSR
jgi:hypothetical protein